MEFIVEGGGPSALKIVLFFVGSVIIVLLSKERVVKRVFRSESSIRLYRVLVFTMLLVALVISFPVFVSLSGPVMIKDSGGQLVLLMNASDLRIVRYFAPLIGILIIGIGLVYYFIMIQYVKLRFIDVKAYLEVNDVGKAKKVAYLIFVEPLSSGINITLIFNYFVWATYIVSTNSVIVDSLVMLTSKEVLLKMFEIELFKAGMISTMLILTLLFVTPLIAAIIALYKIKEYEIRSSRTPWRSQIPRYPLSRPK